jgi:hypothetical protein
MREVATGFRGGPAIGFLGAAIPEQNVAIHIADDDGVVSELQQFGLKLSASDARNARFSCSLLPTGFIGHSSGYLVPDMNGDGNRSDLGRSHVTSPGDQSIAGG